MAPPQPDPGQWDWGGVDQHLPPHGESPDLDPGEASDPLPTEREV